MSLYSWIEKGWPGVTGSGTLRERDDAEDEALGVYVDERRRTDAARSRAKVEAQVEAEGTYCQGDDWGWWAFIAMSKDLQRHGRNATKNRAWDEVNALREEWGDLWLTYLGINWECRRPQGYVFVQDYLDWRRSA